MGGMNMKPEDHYFKFQIFAEGTQTLNFKRFQASMLTASCLVVSGDSPRTLHALSLSLPTLETWQVQPLQSALNELLVKSATRRICDHSDRMV